MIEKLSNCPWCGSDHVEPDYGVFAVHPKTWGSGRMVSTGCLDCGASGPEKINIQESSDAWNLFCAKLNRLAALEAVAREIIKESPPTPWSDDPEMNISQDTEWHVKYLIAQRLKTVLEET